MGHADFRIGGRIFATLGYPSDGFGAVMLSPADQAVLVAARPETFQPAKGAWGARGSTMVVLARAPAAVVRDALRAAAARQPPRRRR